MSFPRLSLLFSSLLLLSGSVVAHADQTETYTISFYDFGGGNSVAGDPSNTLMGTGTITVSTPDDSTYTVTGFNYSLYPGTYASPVEPTSNSYNSADLASPDVTTAFANFGVFFGFDFYDTNDPLYTYYGDGNGWSFYDPSTGYSDGGYYTIAENVPMSSTPEPGSLALLGTGVLGAAAVLRRRVFTA